MPTPSQTGCIFCLTLRWIREPLNGGILPYWFISLKNESTKAMKGWCHFQQHDLDVTQIYNTTRPLHLFSFKYGQRKKKCIRARALSLLQEIPIGDQWRAHTHTHTRYWLQWFIHDVLSGLTTQSYWSRRKETIRGCRWNLATRAWLGSIAYPIVMLHKPLKNKKKNSIGGGPSMSFMGGGLCLTHTRV